MRENLNQNSMLDVAAYQDFVESLPIGTLVYTITDGKVDILAINDRLLDFANQVHNYVETRDEAKWSKETLYKAFSANLYAFSTDEDVPIVKELVEEAVKTGYSQRVFRLRGTSGENTKWMNALCSCRDLDEHTKIYFTLFMDNTNQVLYEKQLLDKQKELEIISKYDPLTGLYNRYSYNNYLEKNKFVMKYQTGFLFADINGLKAANDEFGHLFGDSLIVSFAEMLRNHFKQEEIYRISGDEFVVIRENVEVTDFEETVKEFMREVDENHTASVGYKWETTVPDLKQAIYQTEQLMIIQKQRYYIESSNLESKHRPRILKELLEEMEKRAFVVYLQPKAAMNSTEVIGAEALIRKIGKDGRVVPPFEFVPILEKEMLISKVDFFVLEEVCKLLQKWDEQGRRKIKISVNMSRVSLAETNFLDHILEICNKYQADRGCIEFEITESTDTKDNRKLLEIVSTLSELGFGVSLDDMGSEYSSLKMVTMRGVDTVKIDRSLVLQIEEKEGAALIRYIIALCHEIGKKCIAEGVEDLKQAAILADMHCDYYQGYLLNRPVPVEEFEQYLEN